MSERLDGRTSADEEAGVARLEWRKSTKSGADSCVIVAPVIDPEGSTVGVMMGDNKPEKEGGVSSVVYWPILEWTRMVQQIKEGADYPGRTDGAIVFNPEQATELDHLGALNMIAQRKAESSGTTAA